MDQTTLKVATFAVPLSGNKGSASMTLGLLNLLEQEGVTVETHIYSYYPDRDREEAEKLANVDVLPGHPIHLPWLILRIILGRLFGWALPKSMTKAYEQIRSRDVVLLVGGTTFADSMLYKVPWNVLAALPAYFAGRPFAFLSQTMGPFNKPLNKLCAKWTLSRASAVHGRGLHSTENVKNIGITQARYSPDLSLAMPKVADETSLKKWAEEIRNELSARSKTTSVGVTPNTIVESKMESVGVDYASLMAAVVVELNVRGHLPVIIPHSFRGKGESAHNNDVNLCQKIIDQLPEGTDFIYVNEDLSSAELRALVGEFYYLVASRFHSMISALSVTVPPITLGWGNQKYTEVLEIHDATDLYIDFANASLDSIRAKLDLVEDRRDHFMDVISKGHQKNLSLLDETREEIWSYANLPNG